MRLFCKHLLRSVIKKPLQPFVLIFTVMLAVSVCIMAFGIHGTFVTETAMSQEAEYGTADITVKLNGTSKSRFMFTDDVRRVLGDGVSVSGSYEFPFFYGENMETVLGAAVDYYEVGDVFSLSFTDYMEFRAEDIADIAFITEGFAEKHGLSAGDIFKATALGVEREYTVGGISPRLLLGSYDVIVDITSAMRIIAADSLFVSAIGKDFKPYSTLFISLAEGQNADECAVRLAADASFSEKSIDCIQRDITKKTNVEAFKIIIDIAIMFSCILSAAVTFCCFYILSSERSEENAVFRAAGAKPGLMNGMQYGEITVYWLLGSLLGIPLSRLLLELLVNYSGFAYADASLSIKNVAAALGIQLAVCLFSATVFIIADRYVNFRGKIGMKGAVIPAVGAVAVLSYVATLVLPITYSFGFGIVSVCSMLLFMFIASPYLLRFLANRVSKALSGGSPSLFYAVKNVYSVGMLHNFSRLIALLVAVISSVFLVIFSVDGYVNTAKTLFASDYAVINATENCYKKVLQCDSAEQVDKAYFGSGSIHGSGISFIYLISVSDVSALSEELGVSSLPSGNAAILSRGQADASSTEVGDSFYIESDGVRLDFELAEIVDAPVNFVIFDCENYGISHNMILVKGDDGVNRGKLLSDLTEKTAIELAPVISTEEIMKNKLEAINVYIKSGNVLLSTIIIFSLIAIVDNLAHSYRRRRDDFNLYRYAGMSSSCVGRMKLYEVLITFIYGAMVGFLVFFVLSFAINRGLSAAGYRVFISLKRAM
jgi:hypothetical protein